MFQRRESVLTRRKVVARCALVPGSAYTVIYSLWWMQEVPETCRVVNKWSFIHYHVGRRSSDVYLCHRLYIQLCSWWWVQEAPETCRVVKKWSFILCHVGRRSSDVYLCQRLHIQLCSWWCVQEAPETCRVVEKCSNKIHCPAASCWFIEY